MNNAAPSAAPQIPAAGCDVGVIFAVSIEADAFSRLVTMTSETQATQMTFHEGTVHGRRVVWCVSGVGVDAATAATRLLVDGHHPRLVVSAGFAGGLDPNLRRGSVVRPAVSVVEGDSLKLSLAYADPEPGLPMTIITASRVVASVEEKRCLAERSGGHVVDMETHAVAAAARAAGLACASVRVISDDAGQELPREVASLAAPQSAMRRLGSALAAVGRRPRAAIDLWRLYEHAVVDGGTLAAALVRLIDSLPTAASGR
jgi:adenosylhomocysteine nucleosidase